MLEALKELVCAANLRLVAEALVIQTFGNVSGVDRASGCMVIKPSGVPYDGMTARCMVVVSLATGEVVEGPLRPSSDTNTHLELYRRFEQIGGVVHTHSVYATIWAQAAREIPPYGTTHADYFHGPVPCTRPLTGQEIADDYETNIGKVIVERFTADPTGPLDSQHVPAVLVAGHGPFAWGDCPDDAVANAVILEYVALTAWLTEGINPNAKPIADALLDKHFFRKHGPGKYYGQK